MKMNVEQIFGLEIKSKSIFMTHHFSFKVTRILNQLHTSNSNDFTKISDMVSAIKYNIGV